MVAPLIQQSAGRLRGLASTIRRQQFATKTELGPQTTQAIAEAGLESERLERRETSRVSLQAQVERERTEEAQRQFNVAEQTRRAEGARARRREKSEKKKAALATVAKVVGFAIAKSDLRLKEHVAKITNPLDKVNQLNGISFNWKKGDKVRQIGLVAQDVEKVLPELVIEEEDGYKAVNYTLIIPLLVEAIKALSERKSE